MIYRMLEVFVVSIINKNSVVTCIYFVTYFNMFFLELEEKEKERKKKQNFII